MKDIDITCDYCTAPMKFVERVNIKKSYRCRRFQCHVCGEKKTIFASGEIDENLVKKKFPETIEQVIDFEQIIDESDEIQNSSKQKGL